jgi:hypothetical protein
MAPPLDVEFLAGRGAFHIPAQSCPELLGADDRAGAGWVSGASSIFRSRRALTR